jgi:hypothetical protein
MGAPVSLRKRLWIGGLAAGGVAVAHALAFLIVAPDPVRRREMLAETGHGAWPLLVSIAMGAVAVSLTRFALGRSQDGPATPYRSLFRQTAARLVPLQLGAFLVLEMIERTATGHALTGLAEPVIWIGLVAQVVVALMGAALLALFARLVDGLVLLLRPTLRAPRPLLPSASFAAVSYRSHAGTAPANPRGPPPSR